MYFILVSNLNEFDFDASEFEGTILEQSGIELNIPTSSTSIRKQARREILTTRLSACLEKCQITIRDGVNL